MRDARTNNLRVPPCRVNFIKIETVPSIDNVDSVNETISFCRISSLPGEASHDRHVEKTFPDFCSRAIRSGELLSDVCGQPVAQLDFESSHRFAAPFITVKSCQEAKAKGEVQHACELEHTAPDGASDGCKEPERNH